MPNPDIKDAEKEWKPSNRRKWVGVPVNGAGEPEAGPDQPNPFDPEDPGGDWGAYRDTEGQFVVDYCGDGPRINWSDLWPVAPAKHNVAIHIEGSDCTAGEKDEDIQVEVTARAMWFREYRCALVVQTSMSWKVTRQKWVCDGSNMPVGPGGPGVWRKAGDPVVETPSRSRKTEFRCC